MNKRIFLSAILLAAVVAGPVHASSLVISGAKELVEVLLKKGGGKAAGELAEFGGTKAVQNVLGKAAKEGGDDLVKSVIRYGKKYGISAVKTMDHAPALYSRALSGLPADLVERALWAAQREPEAMTRLLRQYGPEALHLAARHRGVGTDIIRKLGDDGIRISRALTEKQAVTLARNADDIARLPVDQRKKVVDAILSAPARLIDYIEKHPKVFASAAGIATFLAIKDDIFGSHETVTVHSDGSKTFSKDGFIERQISKFSDGINMIFYVITAIIAGLGCIRIYAAYRKVRERERQNARNNPPAVGENQNTAQTVKS